MNTLLKVLIYSYFVSFSGSLLSTYWRGVHVHQRCAAMQVDQAEVRDTGHHAVQPRGEEDPAGSNDPVHKVLCVSQHSVAVFCVTKRGFEALRQVVEIP